DPLESSGPVQRVEVVVGMDAAQVVERGRPGGMDGGAVQEAGGVEEGEDPLAALGVEDDPRQLDLIVPAVDELDARPAGEAGEPPLPPARGFDEESFEQGHGRGLASASVPRWPPSLPPREERRRSPRPADRAPAASAPS